MLRRFLYLNEASVDSYIGVIEGGLTDETIRRRGQKGAKGGEGGLSAGPVSARATGQREHSQDDESVVRDTPEHRFDRLMKAVQAEPDTWNYEEVLDVAEVFEQLSTGTLISVDCELEVPPAIALLSQPREFSALTWRDSPWEDQWDSAVASDVPQRYSVRSSRSPVRPSGRGSGWNGRS